MATYHHNGHDSRCHCDKNINSSSVDTTIYHDSNINTRNMQTVITCDICSIEPRKMWLNPANLVSNSEVQPQNNTMVPVQAKHILNRVPLFKLSDMRYSPTYCNGISAYTSKCYNISHTNIPSSHHKIPAQPHTPMCNTPHTNKPSPHHTISTEGCNIPHINANIFIQ